MSSYNNIKSEELELQYSPSKWVRRLSATEVVDKHVELVQKVSEENRNHLQCELDISYGPTNIPNDDQKIDIFGTNLPKNAPWFVYFHGGYWQQLSRGVSSYPARPLVEQGCRVAVPGYSLCPQVTLHEIVRQARRAAIWCLQRANNMGASSVAFCGHSAGAHLVAMFLTDEFFMSIPEALKQLVRGACLISGIYDLTPLTSTSVNGALNLTNEEAAVLSPIGHTFEITKKYNLKIRVVFGELDSPAFKMQSLAFAELFSNFDNFKSHCVDSVDHFNIVEQLTDPQFEVTSIIKQIIF